jgi:hypothetical protein
MKERVEEDTLDMKDRVSDKMTELKGEAGKKLQQGVDKARETKDYVVEKGVELKDKVAEKGKGLKKDMDKKVEDLKEGKDRTVEKGKEKLEEGKKKLEEGVDKAREVKDDVIERGKERLEDFTGEDQVRPQLAGTKLDDRGIFKIKEIHDERDIENLKRSEERRSNNPIKKEGEHILSQGEDTAKKIEDDRSMAQKVVGGVKETFISGFDKAKEIIGLKRNEDDTLEKKVETDDDDRDRILEELRQTTVSRPEREEGTDLRENVTEEEDKTLTEKFTDTIRHGLDRAKEFIGIKGEKDEVLSPGNDDLEKNTDELKLEEEDKNRQETSSMVFI